MTTTNFHCGSLRLTCGLQLGKKLQACFLVRVRVRVQHEQWIRAKYERCDFRSDKDEADVVAAYQAEHREGYLWKRGREDRRFQRRLFVLEEDENTLRYYNSDNVSRGRDCNLRAICSRL